MGGNHFSDRRRVHNFRRQRIAVPLLTAFLFFAMAAAGQRFFPSGAFYPDNLKLDSRVAAGYSNLLTALQEPSLLEAKQDSSVQSYRFIWLRSFHRPVIVRVLIHPDGSATVVGKMGAREGGHKSGDLAVSKTQLLSADRVRKLSAKIQSLGYWTLPERDPDLPGLDGSRWVIEGVDRGSYRVVDRWSPKRGPVRKLGLLFFGLSRLKLGDEPIY